MVSSTFLLISTSFLYTNIAAVFGKGVYYAANASYSFQDKYSTPDKDGNKHILVCSLLIGHTIKGQKDMKIAPNLPNDPMVSKVTQYYTI